MKTRLFSIVLLLTAICTHAQAGLDKWPAVKELHTVVSQTFHPAEEGNLEPIKSRSEELYNKASALLKSDIPAEFRSPAILNAAQKLQIKSLSLHKLVLAKAPDTDIAQSLTELHNIFHEIIGLCTGEK